MEKKFNILIRTNYRPAFFSKCIDSIMKQTYKNYEIFVIYDDDICLNYLNNYKNNINFFKSVNNNNYNLYYNELLNKVENGWIIFLDDDDMFSTNNMLEQLDKNLNNETINLIHWKFNNPHKNIFFENLSLLNLDNFKNSSVCFNKSILDNFVFNNKNDSFYKFILHLKNKNINCKFLDKIFTETIWKNKFIDSDNKILKQGSCRKKYYDDFKEFFYHNYYKKLPFDKTFYLMNNKDLRNTTYFKKAKKHYILFGKKEMRICNRNHNKNLNYARNDFEYYLKIKKEEKQRFEEERIMKLEEEKKRKIEKEREKIIEERKRTLEEEKEKLNDECIYNLDRKLEENKQIIILNTEIDNNIKTIKTMNTKFLKQIEEINKEIDNNNKKLENLKKEIDKNVNILKENNMIINDYEGEIIKYILKKKRKQLF